MAQHKFLIFRMATKETSQIEAGIIDRSQDQESPWTSPGSGKFRVGGVRGAVLRGPAELLLRWPRWCCCLLWGCCCWVEPLQSARRRECGHTQQRGARGADSAGSDARRAK